MWSKAPERYHWINLRCEQRRQIDLKHEHTAATAPTITYHQLQNEGCKQSITCEENTPLIIVKAVQYGDIYPMMMETCLPFMLQITGSKFV